ncbi:MAG TPA: hypothetical protein DCZ61_01610 [Lachnospiraceae bacterium]|nr:hypothetical protein [Lachnospiraceae bacterium]
MKKIAVLISIILLISTPLSALADSLNNDQAPGYNLGKIREDEEIEDCLISAYGVESSRTTIYTFAKSDHLPDDSLRMRLLINGDPAQGQGDGDGYVQPTRYDSYIKDSGAVTRYLVLIDCSTSMPAYKADIQAFVRSLIETNNSKDCDAAYTIAGCGTQMEVFGQADMTDLNKVMDVLNTVDYGQQGTDFYTGVISALKYLRSQPLNPGSLTNLILITDGIPFIEGGADAQKLAESAKNKIEDTPEILMHTLCLNHWEGGAEKYVASGPGRQDVLSLERNGWQEPSEDEIRPARRSGRKIAELVNKLYVCAFSAENLRAGSRAELQIECKYRALLEGDDQIKLDRTRKTNSIRQARVLAGSIAWGSAGEDSPEERGGDDSGSDDPGLEDSGSADTAAGAAESTDRGSTAAEKASTSAAAEYSKENLQDSTASAAISANAGTTEGSAIAGTGENGSQGEKDKDKHRFPTIPIIPIVLLAAAAAAVSAMFVKKKKEDGNDSKKDEPESPAPPAAGPGIKIRIDVFAGGYKGEEKAFLLRDELIAGSDPDSCDIVFEQEDVSPRHCRIFINEGLICIEDLDSAAGTFLGGMRLYSAKRLRSGDEIRVGDAGFIPWF